MKLFHKLYKNVLRIAEIEVDHFVRHNGDVTHGNIVVNRFNTLSRENQIALIKYSFESHIDTNKELYSKIGNDLFARCDQAARDAIVQQLLNDFPQYEKQMQAAIDHNKRSTTTSGSCWSAVTHFRSNQVEMEAYKATKAWDMNAAIIHQLNPMVPIAYPPMYMETKTMLGNLVNADLESRAHRPHHGVRR